ncbi:gp53-like domain-containing protein [Limoniibacter endophyticus]|uniref:Uncharacterized protein n=1 Tax=Limoniibacter endophyticus TaxID=1565040 RepID=A0A8J3DQ61_9HYPH|nr:hypothetical protein [Limoniibacter endophyticus]GHC79312.1 hypothetical protein GCM10010136_31760 [Limoniibacter endophyticus]
MANSFYNTGTATVAANGTVVTGQGTAWGDGINGPIRPGDVFGMHSGFPTIIKTVAPTQLTLETQYKGPAQTAAAYIIGFTPYNVTLDQDVREMIRLLRAGVLPGLATLPPAASSLLGFDAAGQPTQRQIQAFMNTFLTASTAGAAQSALGGGAAGRNVFTAASTADARSAINTIGADQAVTHGFISGNKASPYTRHTDGTVVPLQTALSGAWTDARASAGGSGSQRWWKLPNNMLVQMGSSVMTLSAGGNVVIPFPTAFAAVPIVQALDGDMGTSSSGRIVGMFNLGELTTTSFNVSVRPSPGAVNIRINWLAVGAA